MVTFPERESGFKAFTMLMFLDSNEIVVPSRFAEKLALEMLIEAEVH
jgi:hypothetical protein